MADLAMSGSDGPVTLGDISERQRISLSYLEQLFGKLRRNSLVSSVRGPGGGYLLAKPASDMSISEIILAVDEPIDATQCGGKENCHDEQKCITHDLWTDLNRHIFDYLGSVKLSELVNKQTAKSSQVSVVELVDKRKQESRVTPAAV
jgi:Rrf2 family iron-sulfur cluster assembly transcriptional regulator